MQTDTNTTPTAVEIQDELRMLYVERALAELEGLASDETYMADLLDGLQALARGDSAPLEHTEVDFADLVGVAVAAARSRHPGVTWSCALPDEAVVVRGWEPGLRILVDNLVENAVRHGGGAVGVTLSADGPALFVDDDGDGVAADERERIFEPFVRANGTTAPGSGLGLALVGQQVRAHEATVEVGTSALGGARFAVRF